MKDWDRMLKNNGVLMDVKSMYAKDLFQEKNIIHWKL